MEIQEVFDVEDVNGRDEEGRKMSGRSWRAYQRPEGGGHTTFTLAKQSTNIWRLSSVGKGTVDIHYGVR